MKRLWRRLYWNVLHPMHRRLLIQRAARGDREKLRALQIVEPYTMVGYPRLLSAFDIVRKVDAAGVPGAIVECGVFKGGSSGMMALAAAPSRHFWLFDSFEGLPEPGPLDGEKAVEYAGQRASGALAPIQQCVGPRETVEQLFFEVLRIDRDRVHFRQGWFQDTVPAARNEIGPIAVLRLDGDWYDSTKVCLDGLYERVVPGGYVIIDDYGFWEGSRRAVDEFLEARGLSGVLERVDDSAFWRVR